MGNSVISLPKGKNFRKMAEKFRQEELKVLQRTFIDLANRSPGKTIDKITFLRVFKMPGMLGERLFAAFDRKKNGVIDLEEFVSGLGLIVRGDLEEKINFLFTMYDLKGDGVVSRKELSTMLNSVVIAAYTILTASDVGPQSSSGEPLDTEVSSTLSRNVEKMVQAAFAVPNGQVRPEEQRLSQQQFKDWLLKNSEALDIVESMFSIDDGLQVDTDRRSQVTFKQIISSPLSPAIKRNASYGRMSLLMSVDIPTSVCECPKCKHIMKFKHCNQCGDLASKSFTCARCGPIIGGKRLLFCVACGFRLNFSDKPSDDFKKIVSSPSNISYMEGWLFKVGSLLKNLKLRWFVQKNNFLYSFHSEQSLRPSGVIYLEGCFVESVDHSKQSPRMQYGIEILMSQQQNKKRVLYAKSIEQQKCWLEAIRRGARQFALEDYYTVGKQLGIGKFSSVHLCTHKASGKNFAVKIIDKANIDAEEREALRTEIAVLQLVHHQHIIHLKHVFETKQKIFIVTDLVEGGDLFDRIVKRRRFEEPVARTIITQILEAIQYLHERGIVHRDLKPENIMLVSAESDDNVKLGDFGLSKFAVPEEIMKLPCGTLAYVAPEVLEMKGYKKEVDLWSVGVIMYVLLRGRLPFDSKVRSEVIAKTLSGVLPIKDDPIWENISPECISLVRGLLESDTQKRLSVRQALRHPWITGCPYVDSDADAEAEADDGSSCSSLYSELLVDTRNTRHDQFSSIESIIEESPNDIARSKSAISSSAH